MAKAKPKWYSMSVDEIEKHLRTDRHTGLTKEEAERRKGKSGTLFRFPDLSAKEAIKLVMSDVATYYIAIIAMLCLVFQRWLEAVVVLIIIAANSALTAFLKVISNKYENAVMAPSIPRCDVLRDGKIVSVDSRCLVEGDVIFVKAGDIISCDIRVIKPRDLLVYETVEDENGKLSYATTKKIAEPQSTDAVEKSGRMRNMIHAGSMINGGYGMGIVVACGKNTVLGNSGNVIEMKSENGICEIDDRVNRLFRYITIGLLAMLIPFIFVALFSKDSSASPIDCIIQIGAVAASLPMQTVTVIYSTVICCVVRYCASSGSRKLTSSAVIKKYSTAERLSEIKKIFLIGKKSVSGSGICVENVYAAFKETSDPELSDNPGDVKAVLEHAYVINKIAMQMTSGSPVLPDRTSLLANELRHYGIDCREMMSGYTVMSYKVLGAEDKADSAIVSLGNDFKEHTFLICRSLDRRIIDCAKWYSANGVAVMINDHLRERLVEVFTRYKALGYEVISIAKSASQFYDKSSFEEFDDQLVLEGMIAVGNVYARENSASVLELSKLGIAPVVCLEAENVESLYVVRNVFKDITLTPKIVYASAVKENGETVLDYPDADAYLGFDSNDIQNLIAAQHSRNILTASVVTDFRYLKTAGRSDYIVAYTYDTFSESGCNNAYPCIMNNSDASCSAAKKYADLLVYPVTRQGGGIDGVLNAVKRVRPLLSNLKSVVSYLLFALCARVTAVYLPLLFGRQAMNPAMTLYLGCIVDLLAVIAIATNPISSVGKNTDKVQFSSIWSIIRSNLRTMLSAFLCGALIFVAGMMIPRTAVLEMQSYTFVALMLLQIIKTVFDLIKADGYMTRYRLLFMVAVVAAMVIVTLVFGVIPGIRSVVGLAGGMAAYLRAFIITIITGALVFLDYKAHKKE